MRFLAVAFVAQLFLLPGCVSNEQARYRAAEKDLERCLEENPEDQAACAAIRANRDQEYERYERTAEQAWGCRNSPDGCDGPPD